MTNESLPDELQRLENALIRRGLRPQRAGARDRLVRALEAERASEEKQAQPPSWCWDFPLAAASIVLAMLSLGAIAASDTEFMPTGRIGTMTQQFHTLDAEIAKRTGVKSDASSGTR